MTMTRTLRRALILFAIAFAIYVIPLAYNTWVTPFFHIIPSQDVVSASLVPTSILTRGDFYLDQYRKYITNNYPEPYFATDVNNHLVSRYPVAAGVLSIPFIGAGLGTGWIMRTVHIFDVARFTAAFIAAMGVLAFFFAVRALTDQSTSVLLTIAYAFGTGVWSTASSGLWQHTPSILFQTLAFFFLIRGIRHPDRDIAPAGLFLSLAVVSRPPVFTIAAVFALYVICFYRTAFIRFVLWAVPPIALMLAYNAAINGSPLVFGYQEGVGQFFNIPQWEAIQGLLFSTGRGLFIYSPFLLLAPFGLWQSRNSQYRFFYGFLAIAFLGYTGIMASWGSLGGWAYGARMLTDTLPAICLLIIPAVEKIRDVPRAALWATVLFAAFIQMLGLYDYGVTFHFDPSNSVWSIENNEPLFYLKLYLSMIRETLGI